MSLSEIYNSLCLFTALSVLFPLILSIIRFKAFNDALKALLFFLILCAVADLSGFTFVSSLNQVTQNIFNNSFTVLESVCIFFIFYFEYKAFWLRKIIVLLFGTFLAFALCKFVFLNKIGRTDTGVAALEAVLVILGSGVYFVSVILDDNTVKLTDRYFFWINFSFLLYFSGSLLIFMNEDYLLRCSQNIACSIYSVHLIVNAFCNLLFAIGIWKVNRIKYS